MCIRDSNQIASGVAGTSYSSGGLAGSTTYYYRVQATKGGVNSTSSNQASATTSASTGVKVNAGGPAVSPYVADAFFTGGTVSGGTSTNIDTSAVTNPAPMAVYQKARFGNFT